LVHTWTSCMYCAHILYTTSMPRCVFSTMMATGHLLLIPKRGEQDRPACTAHHQKKKKRSYDCEHSAAFSIPISDCVSTISPEKKRLILPRSSACHSALDQQDLFSRVGQRFYYIPMLVRNQVFVLRKFCPERRNTKPEQSVHHPWPRSIPQPQSYPSR